MHGGNGRVRLGEDREENIRETGGPVVPWLRDSGGSSGDRPLKENDFDGGEDNPECGDDKA